MLLYIVLYYSTISANTIKVMPPYKNPNFWKVKENEGKEREKGRGREMKGFQWGKRSMESPEKGFKSI